MAVMSLEVIMVIISVTCCVLAISCFLSILTVVRGDLQQKVSEIGLAMGKSSVWLACLAVIVRMAKFIGG